MPLTINSKTVTQRLKIVYSPYVSAEPLESRAPRTNFHRGERSEYVRMEFGSAVGELAVPRRLDAKSDALPFGSKVMAGVR